MKKLKVLAVLLTLSMVTTVHAALQSAPGVNATTNKTANNFFKLIREMEKEGGALGLNATFAENATTGEYEETSASNNIDAHMSKSTEWGAAAMLAVSDYGADNVKISGKYNSDTYVYDATASTTGNITGIFGMHVGLAGYEYVAAGIKSKMTGYMANAAARYVDEYEEVSSSKDYSKYLPGDATYETSTFFTELKSFVTTSKPYFLRGHKNILDFYNSNGNGDGAYYGWGEGGSRLVVWVGEGL